MESGPTDGTNEDRDEQACDSEKIEAEEARLSAWVNAESKLTEKAISDQMKLSRENLQGICSTDLKAFIRLNRWKLLKLLKDHELFSDALDETLEPSEEDLEDVEEKMQRIPKKQGKVGYEKNVQPIPDHLERIGDVQIAVFKASEVESTVENDGREDDHPEYKLIPKGVRRHIKKWMELHGPRLAGYSARTIGGLAIAAVDRKSYRDPAENESAFLAYVERRMKKQKIVQTEQPEIALPQDLETKIMGVDLTQEERKALVFFAAAQAVSGPDKKLKIHPEAIRLASGDLEYDNFECPLCIRSLESKLSSLGVTFDIKCTFGTKHKFQGAQGSRVNWIRIDWNDE